MLPIRGFRAVAIALVLFAGNAVAAPPKWAHQEGDFYTVTLVSRAWMRDSQGNGKNGHDSESHIGTSEFTVQLNLVQKGPINHFGPDALKLWEQQIEQERRAVERDAEWLKKNGDKDWSHIDAKYRGPLLEQIARFKQTVPIRLARLPVLESHRGNIALIAEALSTISFHRYQQGDARARFEGAEWRMQRRIGGKLAHQLEAGSPGWEKSGLGSDEYMTRFSLDSWAYDPEQIARIAGLMADWKSIRQEIALPASGNGISVTGAPDWFPDFFRAGLQSVMLNAWRLSPEEPSPGIAETTPGIAGSQQIRKDAPLHLPPMTSGFLMVLSLENFPMDFYELPVELQEIDRSNAGTARSFQSSYVVDRFRRAVSGNVTRVETPVLVPGDRTGATFRLSELTGRQVSNLTARKMVDYPGHEFTVKAELPRPWMRGRFKGEWTGNYGERFYSNLAWTVLRNGQPDPDS